ncbi:glycosyl hydrolase [Gramella jeungdoensis]|uniref:Glycosyl hydrolase n=1 Tax=Gramella jeungdoensis TaxID=708091 RepID=A0ABT0Z2Y7_9FLAO|nr:glycosyl hydrolase [Gramella jeungdoensis]MCM8570079.1 glycosyl hydrolase [Gramella jeungdoensis]
MKQSYLLGLFIGLFFINLSFPQSKDKKNNKENTEDKVSLGDLKLRNIGPAFLSGRIADIAVHPGDNDIWYVAVGSGGVWKTENSGTTWQPLFDEENSYSTGSVTIDPSNPNIIWVGTGENVGGRHVGYGDGVYKSEDGGQSWKNMGLKTSEHISEIIVHPEDSNIIWVAAQGPLWNKGGERGLYKSLDGGKSWKKVLGGNEWTGVTDIMLDPRNPDRIYAATWQRHRTVASYMGGGPDSGIHRSEDGGETWTELDQGIPKSNLGKIGLAISPQKPDVIYAAIETDQRQGGLFRSEDRGASWTKMSDAVSGATGPHYYQELYASPHEFDRLYLMDVRIQTSGDGGKTFKQLKEEDKHSDNHAIAFRDDDPDYLLVGTDAGIYESFDNAETWSYFKNLPLTQFYKVAVNNAEPFYQVFGGTQDNGSVGGPSRTDEREGIRNAHWFKTLFADGHQSATDPEYNNIIYAETQEGGLYRIDLASGEEVAIQPQPEYGEDYERFNWDSPILVSPHKASRIYFASQRVWRSEDRGNSWEVISPDLTRDEERMELPIMGRKQSYDNPWDVLAMSNYNTITSLAESPIQEGIIYAGTDDGFIQVSKDAGQNWTKVPVTRLGLPARSFVNDIKADLYEANTVYAVLDNHKEGDFSSYIFKSTDAGNSWNSMRGDLPKELLVWRIVQDHEDKNLFFLGTEKGIYTSWNAGKNWHKVPGSPTIPFRDLVIQKRENDLVGASFGRGFFILDDYRALREVEEATSNESGYMFPIRKAYWYKPKSVVGNTGADYYFAENPEYGALITYYLPSSYKSSKDKRKEREKALDTTGKDIPFPGWKALDAEMSEEGRTIWVLIKDENDNIVDRVKAKGKKGINRVAWDLYYSSLGPIEPGEIGDGDMGNVRVVPGNYSATLVMEENAQSTVLAGPENFEVVPLRETTLDGAAHQEIAKFWQRSTELFADIRKLNYALENAENKVKAMRVALNRTRAEAPEIKKNLYDLDGEIRELKISLEGSPSKAKMGEKVQPNLRSHFIFAFRGSQTTYGPTAAHKRSMNIAERMYNDLRSEVSTIVNETIPALENKLNEIGAPNILDGELKN